MSYFFGNEIQTVVSRPVGYCMRSPAMRFSTKVFEHTEITRWQH